MNDQVKAHIAQYPEAVIGLFFQLRQLVFDSAACPPEERLWARLPSYYAGQAFVRLIPFKDHINIEAAAVALHREELRGYRITPKGMLQIYPGQELPQAILAQIFAQTLCG